MVGNNPVGKIDYLGMWETSVHHDIVTSWLSDPKYSPFKGGCCEIDVAEFIIKGSDDVDGVDIYLNWPAAQSTGRAYQHAMREPGESASAAEAKYRGFVNENIQQAIMLSNDARRDAKNRCKLLKKALVSIGKAFHAYSDSLSPAHSGFQPWYGPIDGVREFGEAGYYIYIEMHKIRETDAVYRGMKGSVVSSTQGRFQNILDYILKE